MFYIQYTYTELHIRCLQYRILHCTPGSDASQRIRHCRVIHYFIYYASRLHNSCRSSSIGIIYESETLCTLYIHCTWSLPDDIFRDRFGWVDCCLRLEQLPPLQRLQHLLRQRLLLLLNKGTNYKYENVVTIYLQMYS